MIAVQPRVAARPKITRQQLKDIVTKRKVEKDTEPWQPQPESPLLSLPGELLNEIYRAVLVTDAGQELNDVARPPIVAVCRQTRQEATQIFLKKNKFVWKLDLNSDWTLRSPARYSLPKWLRHAAKAEAPAYFGELVIWLVAPPKSRAFDYMARLCRTSEQVRLCEGVYHKFNYVYCTIAQANFCTRRNHTCDRDCGGKLYMVRENRRQMLDDTFSGLAQLKLPELGIADVMALGKDMTDRFMSWRQKCMLRLPLCREIIWKRTYAPVSRSEMGSIIGAMQDYMVDRTGKNSRG